MSRLCKEPWPRHPGLQCSKRRGHKGAHSGSPKNMPGAVQSWPNPKPTVLLTKTDEVAP